jgi:protease-4
VLRFFTRLFAVIGFLCVLFSLVGAGILWYAAEGPNPEPDSSVLVLALDEPVLEKDEPSPLDFALHKDTTALYDMVRAIDLAKDDPHVKAIVGRFGSTMPSLAQDEEIRAAILRFKQSGKPTYAFATSYGDFGNGNRAYYLASAFDSIWVQPVGSVGLSGLAIEMPFAKSALGNIGISGEFLRREEYKSAMDNITRDDFEPQVRIETQDMIDDLAAQVAAGVADGRKMTPDQVKQLMANGPYTDEEALKAGLVTRIGYADELERELDDKAGKDVAKIGVGDYLDFDHPENPNETKVALICGDGVIVDKAEGPSGIPGESPLGADEIAQAFDDAARDDNIKAILFRIDSPGGSPEASETIRRSLIQAQKKGKPVIVSMGDVAASGGYWVAMNADRIVAEPATITGSIGVFAGKFLIGDLMQKIGVHWEMLKTADAAGMWSMTDHFTPPQLDRLNALLDETYRIFVTGVSDARKIPIAKMPDIAKGRVWTGDQAIKIGLVDKLGGYDAAFDEVREQLKLAKDAPIALETFPAPETPFDRVRKLLKNLDIESAALGPFMLEWQKVASMLGYFEAARAMKPEELLAPQAALGTVQ